MQNVQALILNEYNGKLLLQHKDIPDLAPSTLLVKVQASTINPSDVMFIHGHYFNRPLPTVAGLEGVGRVVKVNGESLEKHLNKRVVFYTNAGSWAEYTVVNEGSFVEIDQDVPVSSAASGFINPLTVLNMISYYNHTKSHGIIHTAAASALGRQLNKLANKLNIPLLNIVRKQEQADLLRSQGAKNVLITQGDWVPELKQHIKNLHLDLFFDCLAGGEVSKKIIYSLAPRSNVEFYGWLSREKIEFDSPTIFFSGIRVGAFNLTAWRSQISQEERDQQTKNYSELLKNELASFTYKEFSLKEIDQAIQVSQTEATKGKVLLRI